MSIQKINVGSSNTVGRLIRVAIITALASVTLMLASGGVAHASI